MLRLPVLDDAARTGKPGKFVPLSEGVTHYQWGGPPDGAPVVLVHGFSVPYYIWDTTFNALSQAGYRVLRYDLFGRGWSDRPPGAYDIARYLKQLRELCTALHIQQPFHLLGLSMGGPIAASFAKAFPESVRSLGLFDPAGGAPVALSWVAKLALLPGVAELLLNFLRNDQLVNSIAKDFYKPEYVESFQEQYRPQMDYHGFKHALLSSVRHGMLDDWSEVYREIGRGNLPVMLVWGEQDKTVPFSHSRLLRQYIPQTEFLPVPEAGHLPHVERSGMVHPALLDFLRRQEAA